MPNILTIYEAMSALQTDNDFDSRIKNALPAIDIEIFIATGIKWETEQPIYPLAKKVAEIKLRISLDMSTNPQQDLSRETYYLKQLQAEALAGARFVESSGGGGGGSITTNADDITEGTLNSERLSDTLIQAGNNISIERNESGEFVINAEGGGSNIGGTLTLNTSEWNELTAVKTVTGLTNGDIIKVAPQSREDATAWAEANIWATHNGSTLTFTAETVPTGSITIVYEISKGVLA